MSSEFRFVIKKPQQKKQTMQQQPQQPKYLDKSEAEIFAILTLTHMRLVKNLRNLTIKATSYNVQ